MDHLERTQRKAHPRDRNNIVSNIFFLKGFKQDLQESDLYDVAHNYKSKDLGDQLEAEWEIQKKKRKNLSVIRLMISCYGYYYILLGFMQAFINVLSIVIQPYALGKVVAYFAAGQTQISRQDVYFYTAVVIGFNFFNCVYRHNYFLLLGIFAVKVRAAFCSFMYRKALKLSPAHLGDITIGKIVTLITKDVDTFEAFIDFGNDIWIAVVKTLVVSFILYHRIGISSLAGVGFFFIMMPIQIYLGSKVTAMKLKMCKTTDQRLQLTQETLSAIRIIKMYTWEKIFDDKISAARKKEIYKTYKIFAVRHLIIVLGTLNSHIAFYLMMMTYVWLGNPVTAEIVYFIMSTFHHISQGLALYFPIGIYQTAELKSAIKRIGHILKAMELDDDQITNTITILPKINLKDVTVSIHNNKILKDINLNVEKGLTLITGPVGSGKSFLLKTILQDYKPDEGDLRIEGTVSYSSQEPWLFPSSIRQNILFGEKYNEKRYNEVLKVCALIYDFDLLEVGDSTIVEDRGINLSKGQQARINLARAIYKDSDIYLLDDPLAALDGHVSSFIFKECVLGFLKDKLVVLVSHNVKYVKSADVTVVLQNGEIERVGKMSELNENEIEFDENEEKQSRDDDDDNEADEETKLITETTTVRKVYHEEKKSGEVSTSVYKKYIKFGGGFFLLFLVFCTYIVAQFCVSYMDKLVSEWVNLEEKISNYSMSTTANATAGDELNPNRKYMFFMYSFITIATTLTTFGRAVALLLFVRSAAIRLHKQMISTIVNATMQFFDTNFIGNILNRFSKDLITVDEAIPFAFYHVFRVFLVIVGIIALIASVNTTFLIPTAVFLAILLIIRRCCLRTSRSLKRLDALTRSPVVGHLNASLEGLTTIRAFKAQSILRDEFDRHQDLYTSASYVLVSSMRAFAFIMDTLCGFFIAFIVLRFVLIDNDILAGHVGLAISQAFSLTGTLQWGIRQWAEIENRMTSVERVLEYTEIKKENKQGLEVDDWPKLGKIKYEDVFLSYTNSNESVLKNINFIAKPKEKIGIVGRTGAGKSSIVATLFRLYDVEGKISIDGVDTKTLSLDLLRASISIIPQDPVLFTGTIRDNIDPTRKYTDDDIWKSIKISHLQELTPSLDFEIVENGTNFSVGQRQLICLARAVIQKNKIIVLDEATANMDPETDLLIHKTIRDNFQNCTVFTIAHKLHSILHCDKIMVMDRGEIVEFDRPENLVNRRNGMFHKMMAKAGLVEDK